LPFWFSEDVGLALGIAALPFNEVKINYNFRRLDELLVVSPGSPSTDPNELAVDEALGITNRRPACVSDAVIACCSKVGTPGAPPSLIRGETHALYSVLHNDERIKMSDAPRDILIHQIQTAQFAPFKDITTKSIFDIRMSHPVIAFFFAAKNVTTCGEQSNYTTEPNYMGVNPIRHVALQYEAVTRLCEPSDYFSHVHPYFFGNSIPSVLGMHMWSYSLFPFGIQTAGSTNYSKMSNISIAYDMSDACMQSIGCGCKGEVPSNQDGCPLPSAQKYQHVFMIKNHNIASMACGNLGFPSL
jgi:hypothetical protein